MMGSLGEERGLPPRAGRVRRVRRGQALVEYLLMTAMLLFLFTGMYKVLQSNLRNYFTQAGRVILTAYY